MADSIFQSDLKIKIPIEAGEKATLTLNERGELQLIDGRDKLSAQLIRALVNDTGISGQVMNSPVAGRSLRVLLNLVLRNFRQNQLDKINRVDPDFSGFSFYKLNTNSTTTYTKISPDFVTYSFTDTGLTNGIQYKYAVSKAYGSKFESSFTETIIVTPSSFTSKQEVVIGKDVVGMPGDGKVDFYVVYNPKFKGSEILEDLLDLEVKQDPTEPRRYTANIVVQDLAGGQNSIAATRRNPAT